MTDQQLLRELYAGLEVVKSVQSEINRRLGLIEKKLDEEEDAADASFSEWLKWIVQTIGQIVLVTVVVGLGAKFGVEIKW